MDNQVIQSLQNAIAKGDQAEVLAYAQALLAQAGFKVTQPKPRVPGELEYLGDVINQALKEKGNYLPGPCQAVRLTLWVSYPEGADGPIGRLAGFQRFGKGVRVPPNQTDKAVIEILEGGKPITVTYPKVKTTK